MTARRRWAASRESCGLLGIGSLPEIRLDLRNTGLSDIVLTDCGLTGARPDGESMSHAAVREAYMVNANLSGPACGTAFSTARWSASPPTETRQPVCPQTR